MPSLPALARRALLRLRALLFRETLASEMEEEMREHLERAAERYVARGMTPAAARLAARREFGNPGLLAEEGRDARGARWLETLAADARFALRYFARHKATTAIVVAVLALGTGANAVIFSLAQAQFLRPAPAVPDDEAHVRVFGQERPTRTAAWQERRFSLPELEALAANTAVFGAVAGWTDDEVVLGGGDSTGARGVNAQFVTVNFFPALGVPLAAGRSFAPPAAGAADMTAIVSHVVAEERYGGAAAAVGRRIVVNELPVVIVGVAPPRFQGALRNMGEPAVWIPLSARAAVTRAPARWSEGGYLSLFARRAPTASRDQATAFARQVVANALPDSAARVGLVRRADVLPMHAPAPGPQTRETVFAFVAITVIGALVLLVAWTNVSSLMVAAAVGRRHEIAVRLSLGASRMRLLRQLVTESTMLAVAGGLAGLVLAGWVLAYAAKSEIDGVDVAPDAGTLLFVLAVAVASGILFGLSPALHATRGAVAGALRDSGTGASHRSRLQRGFVVAQIALSQPLLLLLGVMLSLVIIDYRPHAPEMSRRVIGVNFRLYEHAGVAGQRPEAVDRLIPRIAERPEVDAVVPAATAFAIRALAAPRGSARAADSLPTIVHVEGAAPGWFDLVEVPIILGRDVSLADTAATDWPVVIGSDVARRLWGEQNPIGRTLASPGIADLEQDSLAMTVVGVYDATRRLPGMTFQGYAAQSNLVARVYTAHGKQWRRNRVMVRTRGPAAPFVPELQKHIRAVAPSLPVTEVLTLAQADHREYLVTLRVGALAGAAGAVALLLASLGLYGVVSLAVRQRTREIGIRIAVGAHPMEVAKMFLLSGVKMSVVALAIGLPLSVIGLRLAVSRGEVIAPGISPVGIGAAIAAILVTVAAAAAWLPARRAALVDPARTLRVE